MQVADKGLLMSKIVPFKITDRDTTLPGSLHDWLCDADSTRSAV